MLKPRDLRYSKYRRSYWLKRLTALDYSKQNLKTHWLKRHKTSNHN